jgi:methionine synthase II (cobalamin-independent)
MRLQQAYADYDEGKIEFAQLQSLQDEAAEDSINRLEATGEPIVTDGEQRESSFATYNLKRRSSSPRTRRSPPIRSSRP